MSEPNENIVPAQKADVEKPFDMAYAPAVKVIKEAIQRSQARALHAVNSEVLSLNYGIGRFISDNSREGFWGTGALAQISSQLQKEMPGLKGYSEASLKDMRTFYEEWSAVINRQPAADDLPNALQTTQKSGFSLAGRADQGKDLPLFQG